MMVIRIIKMPLPEAVNGARNLGQLWSGQLAEPVVVRRIGADRLGF